MNFAKLSDIFSRENCSKDAGTEKTSSAQGEASSKISLSSQFLPLQFNSESTDAELRFVSDLNEGNNVSYMKWIRKMTVMRES